MYILVKTKSDLIANNCFLIPFETFTMFCFPNRETCLKIFKFFRLNNSYITYNAEGISNKRQGQALHIFLRRNLLVYRPSKWVNFINIT